MVFSLFPFYANTCSFLIISFACSEWHDTGGDGPVSKDAAVDFVLCVDGWIVVPGLYSLTPPIPFKADLGLWC